ncbi:MAG: amidophosphoribosyltransferase [Deltaproteobacteria bacterium]|nr:amidophosphoribosyltransferase [Deltaproteobacteria bacterium]
MGGLFGCVTRGDCVPEVFYGTDYHSHLGTRRGGMAMVDGRDFSRSIHNIENHPFRSKFESELDNLEGAAGIGVISDTDPQPLIITSHLGTFALVTVGRINNLNELAGQAFSRRQFFTESRCDSTSPTELVAMLICQEDSIAAGIKRVQQEIRGSLTLLLLTPQGLWAARDRLGRTPLVLGKREDGYCVASESCAMPNLGFELVHYLGPGETLFITPDGYEQKIPPGEGMQICAFLWIYYGYPASSYEGITVEQVRYRCGAALAARETESPDLVAGIPDSGVGHAIGYANARNLPYGRPFVKYTPTWPRSFMPQNQKVRDLVARMKLIPVPELIEGKKLLFVEDSIVRGTQLKGTIRNIFEQGAKEVHMRPACPCLLYPCIFHNFSVSQSSMDLAGRKAAVALDGNLDRLADFVADGSDRQAALFDKIREHLGLSSLYYQNMDDMIAAIGLPAESVCTYCWNGKSRG